MKSRIRRLLGEAHRRRPAPVAPLALALTGLAALGFGIAAQQHAPQPSAADALPPAYRPGFGFAFEGQPKPKSKPGSSLPVAAPVALDVPALGVHHALDLLGRNPDGTLQVPSLSRVAAPGWDRFSPAPGQRGPAVILGHVDSARRGRGVFYELGALRTGQLISVTRADRTVADFRVVGVEKYTKAAFPTFKVFGNTPDPELRLITCGGDFDRGAGSYTSNIVAYAVLTGTRPAAG